MQRLGFARAFYVFASLALVTVVATSSVKADLVGYWRLDGDLNDSSGQGNHGELVGEPEFSEDVSELVGSGQSMFFDGDDAVLLGNPSILNFGTNDWTVSAWAKKEPGARGNIYSNGGDNGGGIRSVLAIGETGGAEALVLTLDVDQGDGAKRQVVSTDEADGFPALTAPDEQWNHVLGMRSGNEARVYVNGELADIISLREDPPYDLSGMSQLPSYIGVGASAASNPIGAFEKWYIGLIDDVAIWNEALDDETIMQLAAGLRGPIAFEPETLGDFNMDGVVDAADFSVIATNLNSAFELGEVSYSKGDTNIDGKVDLNDFLEFRLIFHDQAGGASAAAIPEPNGLLILLIGSMALWSRRKDLDRPCV